MTIKKKRSLTSDVDWLMLSQCAGTFYDAFEDGVASWWLQLAPIQVQKDTFK